MPLTPVDLRRRLAFIRYLHHLGVDQAQLPEPQSSASILMLHDAVEAFLLLAAEHLAVTPSPEFEKYWQAFKTTAGVDLPIRQGMKRLNKLRVNLKHHGGRPDQETIDQTRSDTSAFFQEATPLVFSLDYATVSMADVISYESVRDLVRKAESASANDDQVSAMIALADAVPELLEPDPTDFTDARRLLQFGPPMRYPLAKREIERVLEPPENDHRRRSTGRHRELADRIADMATAVTQLQVVTPFTALGIDFAASRRFQLLTPHIIDTLDGRREYRAPQGYAPTPEEVAWCCQFIVTVALRLAAAEAHLNHPYRHAREWVTIAEHYRGRQTGRSEADSSMSVQETQ